MRSKLNLLAAGGILVVLVMGCTSDSPFSPKDNFRQASISMVESDIDPAELRALTYALFAGHSGAMNQLEQMISSQPATPARINGGENVIARVMEWLAAGTLQDPEGPLTAETGALRLVNLISVFIGRSDELMEEPEPGDDYVIQVVGPETDEFIITSEYDAGALITPGTFQAYTILTILRQDGRALKPPMPSKSAVFDVSLSPSIDFTNFTLAMCADEHLSPAQLAKAIIYHYNEALDLNDPASYDPLERVALPTGLICDHVSSSSNSGSKGWFASLKNKAVRFVTPRSAHAGHAGLAGDVRDISLSPFVAGAPDQIETELELSLVDPVIFGYNAPISATLMAGDDPVVGATIDFTVAPSISRSEITNSSGIAAWSYNQPPVGNFAVTATFDETDDFLASSDSGTLRVRYTSSPGRSFTSPIPNSKYNFGRTVPFKFELYRWNLATTSWGVYGGANVTLGACRVSGGSCIPVSLSPTQVFRYDGVSQYVLNFNSSLLVTKATYRFTARLDDSTEFHSGDIIIQ
jgi:hypothetical protein